MENNWKEVKLGKFIKVKHGFAFPGTHITDQETDQILVTPGNFHIGGGFKNNKFKYFNSNDYPESYILKEGDIVVTMTDLSKESDTLGYGAKIPRNNKVKFLHNQRVGLVEFKGEKEIHNDFVYWVLRTRSYQGYVVGSASGTSIMHTSPSRIEDYDFFLPPLPEQKAIASVLSSLDDKIDLLHQQNQTLEALAETLFRQWFIERCPEPVEGEAKEDWEDCTIEDLCIKINSGGTPSTKIDSYYNGNINWYSTKELNDNYLFSSNSKITQEGLDNSSAKIFPAGTVVIAIYAAPTVGRLGILTEDSAFNQAACGLVANDKICSKEFLYLYLKNQRVELNLMASGSAQQNLNVGKIKSYPCFIPDSIIMEKFKFQVEPLFSKILDNSKQIQTLTKLRDTLLPKLMSGEVRVKI